MCIRDRLKVVALEGLPLWCGDRMPVVQHLDAPRKEWHFEGKGGGVEGAEGHLCQQPVRAVAAKVEVEPEVLRVRR